MAAKAKNAAKPEQPVKAERKISIDRHRRSCVKLYGISPSTFDGATVGLTGDYTTEEMQAIISKWLGEEVK